MFCFLQNLTTSKKQHQNQLQASSTSKKISDSTLFGGSNADNNVNKAKLKCENAKSDGSLCKTSAAVNGKTKKKSASRFMFLRKSR